MKKNFFLFAFLFITLTSNAQLTSETIDVAGVQRSFYQYLPTGFNSSEVLPVVVVLHGIGDNAQNMSGVGFNQIADTARFIPVYLQGEQNGFSQNSWNNGTWLGSSANDILFISSVIDRLEDSIDVDLSRVYITGFSMGGIMSYTACSQLSDRIAAMASFSGTMSQQEISASGQSFPVPTMHVHGTADTQVPYDGNPLPSLSLVNETMDKNKSLNNWGGDSTIYLLPDNVADGITFEKIVYNTTTELELWKMIDADHIWPYQPANDTSAIYAAWYFFRDKVHPNPSTSSLNEEFKTFDLQIYPNPVEDQLHLKFGMQSAAHVMIDVINLLGEREMLLFEGELAEGIQMLTFSTDELASGMYLIRFEMNQSYQTIRFVKE